MHSELVTRMTVLLVSVLRVLTSISQRQFGLSVCPVFNCPSLHLSVKTEFTSFVCINIKIAFCLSDDFKVNVKFSSFILIFPFVLQSNGTMTVFFILYSISLQVS